MKCLVMSLVNRSSVHIHFDHEILRCKPIDLNKYSFFWGHYFRQGIETIPGFKLVFAAVRNPIDRIRSMYKFWNYIDDRINRPNDGKWSEVRKNTRF